MSFLGPQICSMLSMERMDSLSMTMRDNKTDSKKGRGKGDSLEEMPMARRAVKYPGAPARVSRQPWGPRTVMAQIDMVD